MASMLTTGAIGMMNTQVTKQKKTFLISNDLAGSLLFKIIDNNILIHPTLVVIKDHFFDFSTNLKQHFKAAYYVDLSEKIELTQDTKTTDAHLGDKLGPLRDLALHSPVIYWLSIESHSTLIKTLQMIELFDASSFLFIKKIFTPIAFANHTEKFNTLTQLAPNHFVNVLGDALVLMPEALLSCVKPLIQTKTQSIPEIEKLYNHLLLAHQQLQVELGEKEQLIQQLRSSSFSSHFLFLRRWRHAIHSRLARLNKPTLGTLHQHEPKPLKLSRPYKNVNKAFTLSIVTPSFNQGSFLEKTIQSVLQQNYHPLEYIVQDGGSTDNTLEILNRYGPLLRNWNSKKDKGQSHAINLGFQHATGEIMAYLNSDDLLLPGCLDYVSNFFARNSEIDVIYSHRVIIDENGHEIGRWILPPHDDKVLPLVDYIPQETLFWRRSLWEKVGSTIDESFRFAMDWDLLLRFHTVGARFFRVPKFLGAFRVHSAQKTSSQMHTIGQSEIDRLHLQYHQRKLTPQEIHQKTQTYLKRHVVYQKLYRAGILRY